jgi:ribonuclease P protein component
MGEAPERLRRRHEFLAVARRGRRIAAPGVVLQAWRREGDDDRTARVRVGFTVSRKVGGSVVRNRVRRRLRAAAGEVLINHAAPGHDYVLIGRGATPRRPYPALLKDLETAMRKLGVWREETRDGSEARETGT